MASYMQMLQVPTDSWVLCAYDSHVEVSSSMLCAAWGRIQPGGNCRRDGSYPQSAHGRISSPCAWCSSRQPHGHPCNTDSYQSTGTLSIGHAHKIFDALVADPCISQYIYLQDVCESNDLTHLSFCGLTIWLTARLGLLVRKLVVQAPYWRCLRAFVEPYRFDPYSSVFQRLSDDYRSPRQIEPLSPRRSSLELVRSRSKLAAVRQQVVHRLGLIEWLSGFWSPVQAILRVDRDPGLLDRLLLFQNWHDSWQQ